MARAQEALRRLRKLLEGGRYPVNSRLPPERRLAVELGLSRSALREGLALLEAEGRIWRHVGRGTFVGGRPARRPGELSLVSGLTNPAEVMEVRLLLEPRIAAMAALRATAADLAHMEHCLRKSEAARDAQAYELWDGRLHRAVAEAAHNGLLLALFDAMNAVRGETAWGRLREAVFTPARQRAYCAQHRAFVAAIAERDLPKAEVLMRRHIETVRRNLVSADPETLPEAAAASA